MPLFIDPTGNPTMGIGICDRCRQKFPLHELRHDGDSPGLMVCEKDWDMRGKDKLPPRKPENITLREIRPEADIAIDYVLGDDGLPVEDADGYYVEA